MAGTAAPPACSCSPAIPAGGGHAHDGEVENPGFLRFVSFFAVLISSAIGVALPLFGSRYTFLRPDSTIFNLLKCASIGVVLSVAFVHLLPEASEDMDEVLEFPWSGTIALFAAVGTMFLETALEEAIENSLNASSGASGVSRLAKRPSEHEIELLVGSGSGNVGGAGVGEDEDEDSTIAPKRRVAPAGGAGHSHGSTLALRGSGQNNRAYVVAHVLEVGMSVHSVIIGISLGLSPASWALLGAIVAHQLFEGAALGSSILDARLPSIRHALFLALTFAFSTPVGIIIGSISASTSPSGDGEGGGHNITQAAFNALAAGVLIYMGLVDLAAETFRKGSSTLNSRSKIMGGLAMLAGMALMTYLAIWA